MFKILKKLFKKPCSGCSHCQPWNFMPEPKTKNAEFFQKGWLRLCAKAYAGKSNRDFGKLYERLKASSDNYRLERKLPYYVGPCLSEVHSRANVEFDLNIYL